MENITEKQKIIFCDIDGTLIAGRNPVSQKIRQGIAAARGNGHMVFICTGRPKSLIEDEILDVGFDGLICGNGSYIEVGSKIIYEKYIEKDAVRETIEAFNENNVEYLAEGTKMTYHSKGILPFIKAVLKREVMPRAMFQPIESYDIEINKFLYFASSNEQIEACSDVLNKYYDIIKQEPNTHGELVIKNISKASGIQKVIDYFNIPIANTYAFGDSNNDIEMIKLVAHGIAMGNSYQDLIDAADYVTERVEEDGVYTGLKKFGLI